MNDSGRFIVMMIANTFFLTQSKKRFFGNQKQTSIKDILKFIIFVIILMTMNQVVFFFFQPPNLYQQMQISRKMPLAQIKAYSINMKQKIMDQKNLSNSIKIQAIKKLQFITSILSHPARRVTYDTFGQTDTEYAWAFKYPNFLISSIIGSSFFYLILIFMKIMNKNKEQVKQTLKFEIIIFFLAFLWEVEIIMKSQTRFNNPSDLLDNFYNALPIFERRDLVKILLFPLSDMFQFFITFYVTSQSEIKFNKIAKHPRVKQMTLKVRSHFQTLRQNNEHFEDRFQVAYDEVRATQPLEAEIFVLQRAILKSLIYLEGQNMLMDEKLLQNFKYFLIQHHNSQFN